ncbi:MAG: UDP-N-acetylenolpyruvoylglucosamine reductase [Phycisphaerae bacterium]|nr:UDP-N-acetylenolpyruvoylglucosamine reductase [Phycisphaerae bacterium]
MSTRSHLFGDLDVDVQFDVNLGAMTWFGIGGMADVVVRPRSEDALQALVERCSQSDTPMRIFGKGANLLVDDAGVDGVVLKLDHEHFTRLRFNAHGEVDRVLAMSGADLFSTVNELARQGLEGFSQMAGIPGTIGGAVRMNAGGMHGSIGDCIESVSCLDSTGRLLVYDRSQLEFRYRESNLPDELIVSAVLQLEPVDPVELRKKVKEIFAYKKSTQPLADQSAGCAFRNPVVGDERVSAGRLIDEAGCKGLQVGGAEVSSQHANFITTGPDATATHVRRLIMTIQERVRSHHGIEIEPEVVIWSREDGSSR